MSESILLSDSDDEALEPAVQQLDGWRLERVLSAELANAADRKSVV